MKSSPHTFGFWGLALLITGCGAPEITIHSPANQQSFVTEAYINIHATITDDEGLKKVVWSIYNQENTILLDSTMPTSYELQETTSMYNINGGTTKVIITAEDGSGNTSSEEITIQHSY